MENGYRIRVGKTDIETIGIDTPEDLQLAADFLAQQHKKTNENFVVSGRKAIFAHITTEVFPQVFKILSICFSMRKFIFTTLAAAFFALSASADDGLSVKSFRWKDGEYVGDATKKRS